jgi:hypothetical protein
MRRQQLEHVLRVDDVKSDAVDGAIGELSAFHETFGCYAQRVSVTTATCRTAGATGGGAAHFENGAWARAVPRAARLRAGEAGLVDLDILRSRLPTLAADPRVIDRIRAWIVQQTPEA